MKIPSKETAEKLLIEAEQMNPGQWVAHNRVAGVCARKITLRLDSLDADTAYILALLHDIGRREGVCDLQHIIYGYKFMKANGYDDSAQICLTHSFPDKDIRAYGGKKDCTDNDIQFIDKYLKSVEYSDYDRLIQLCDAISTSKGPCMMEKRFVDVTLRYGFNDYTLEKWKSFLQLKEYFDKKTDCDIYTLIDIKY